MRVFDLNGNNDNQNDDKQLIVPSNEQANDEEEPVVQPKFEYTIDKSLKYFQMDTSYIKIQ